MNITTPEKISLSHTLCFMFSGKAGVGKSYCSDNLQNICDTEFKLKTFKSPLATGVKDTARFMGWSGQKDKRGRVLLQKIGYAGREYDEDLWVRETFNRVDEYAGFPYDAIFIDDWRFKNEIDYVKKNEILYKVVAIRIEAPGREILWGTSEYNDISETELDNYDDFDYILPNHMNDTDKLKQKLQVILLSEIKKYSIK